MKQTNDDIEKSVRTKALDLMSHFRQDNDTNLESTACSLDSVKESKREVSSFNPFRFVVVSRLASFLNAA